MHFLNVEAGVPSRLLMYTLIYWLCRMHATQLQPHFLVLERSGVNWNAIWLTAVVTRHLNTHYRRRVWRSIWRAAALVSDNLSSVVPYHYWRPIWPEKVPDQGLSLRLRHVCKTWEAGARNFVSMVPGDKVALPSRKEDTRVPFLARSFFFFAATLLLAWSLYPCLHGFCRKMSEIIVIFDLFFTMCSLSTRCFFLRATHVKFNWLLGRQHVHLKKKRF